MSTSINEGNRLIAEFMGWKFVEADANEYINTPEGGKYWANVPHEAWINEQEGKSHLVMLFDKYWDWLKPVVDKIKDLINIDTPKELFIRELSIFASKENTYSAVLQFIEYYNNNTNSQK
jgi:hypothetical protein